MDDIAGVRELVTFEVDQQRYGVPSTAVEEIIRAVAVAPLPHAPAVIDGVINVRGRLAPVLDLRRRFGKAGRAIDPGERFVLVRAHRRLVSLRADRVLGLTTVEPGAFEPTATIASQAPIAGAAKLPDGLVLVYDLARFVEAAEAGALDQALANAEVPSSEPVA